MDRVKKNSLIWAGVLLVEVIVLKLAKKSDLWFYILLPIIAGFIITEFLVSMSKTTGRNLN